MITSFICAQSGVPRSEVCFKSTVVRKSLFLRFSHGKRWTDFKKLYLKYITPDSCRSCSFRWYISSQTELTEISFFLQQSLFVSKISYSGHIDLRTIILRVLNQKVVVYWQLCFLSSLGDHHREACEGLPLYHSKPGELLHWILPVYEYDEHNMMNGKMDQSFYTKKTTESSYLFDLPSSFGDSLRLCLYIFLRCATAWRN